MKEGVDYVGIGVGAVVINTKGEFLLLKRGRECRNEQGLWEFPGGGLENGETLTDCVVREMREEVGIEVYVTKQLGAFDHILTKEGQHWITVAYLCQFRSGEPHIKEVTKCEAIAWVAPEDLPKYQLTTASVECVHLLRKAGVITYNTPEVTELQAFTEFLTKIGIPFIEHCQPSWRKLQAALGKAGYSHISIASCSVVYTCGTYFVFCLSQVHYPNGTEGKGYGPRGLFLFAQSDATNEILPRTYYDKQNCSGLPASLAMNAILASHPEILKEIG